MNISKLQETMSYKVIILHTYYLQYEKTVQVLNICDKKCRRPIKKIVKYYNIITRAWSNEESSADDSLSIFAKARPPF